MKKILAFVIAASIAVSSAFAADSAAAQKKNKKSKELKEVTWTVNLHCENCVEKVNENLAFEKGVKDLKVSLDVSVHRLSFL